MRSEAETDALELLAAKLLCRCLWERCEALVKRGGDEAVQLQAEIEEFRAKALVLVLESLSSEEAIQNSAAAVQIAMNQINTTCDSWLVEAGVAVARSA